VAVPAANRTVGFVERMTEKGRQAPMISLGVPDILASRRLLFADAE
jgi:hypothetical protein